MQTIREFTIAPGSSAEHSSRHVQHENAPKQHPLSGKRVIIVEDEGITLLQLRNALQRAGLLVVGMASNGKEGVELVLRELPDLVLMDINMPVMDGWEAAARILAGYRVCIVMITAYGEAMFREKAQQIGTCGYIVKPVSSDTLLRPLEEALREFG